MVLGNQEKVSILISALEARNHAINSIRARVQSVCIWALGLSLTAAGWLVQAGVILSDDQTSIFCIGVVAAWIVLRLVFLADLQDGFRAQQKVAAELEDVLGFYAPRRFGPDSEAVYPPTWRQAGANGAGGRFFQSTCLVLDVGLIMLLIAILSRSDWVRAWMTALLRVLRL